ncbi:MAG TPA: 16S rRNA (cytosine(1402)-N(4))-methyltransferase, partial [Bifidobacterium animalis]|nr:16S rRNA (cytosine(1402)-N(4))-methyltransferase [Bifidobacterium animalis]
KADADEIAYNPRSASVRLRAVELTRPLPQRWLHTFELESQGPDDGARGAHSHRRRTHARRG